MIQVDLTQEEFDKLKKRAEERDAIETLVAQFYETYDDDDNEIAPEREGDLGDIGEVVASFLGYL